MPKPQRILLVRHGESAANADKTIRSTTHDHEIGLTPRGHDQARACGLRLRALAGDGPVGFWLSPYRRTHETLAGIAPAFDARQVAHVFEDLRLREQHWGTRTLEEGRALDAQRDACGSLYFPIPGGEMGAQVYDRMTDFIDTICRDFARDDYRVESLIVVCHGYSMRCFAARWFHWPVRYFHSLQNPANCAVFHLELERTPAGREKYRLLTPMTQREPVPADRDLKHTFFPAADSDSQDLPPTP